MATKEIRVLRDSLDDSHTHVICSRLHADRCEIDGRLYVAASVADHLRAPQPVEAVFMLSSQAIRIDDMLVLKSPAGRGLGQGTVASIELSHTDMLTDAERGTCVSQAPDNLGDSWFHFVTSGPIWRFFLTGIIMVNTDDRSHSPI
jgi:hypothetical protein